MRSAEEAPREGKGVDFDLSNLNYVKKKLFDPEIEFLRKKFKEQLDDYKSEMQKEFQTMIY